MPRVNDQYYENKRKEIIEAAYRVCIRKPITSVVMKDVIAETGFSHGVIYKYYRDIDEVLRDLVITINAGSRIDDRLDNILKECGTKDWKSAICRVCDMLADYMMEVGVDLLKVSLYSDMLAMSEPERVAHIAGKIGKEQQSPLLYLVASMSDYLMDVVKENSLSPRKSVDEILQYMIVTFHGIETGYVLAECYQAEHLKGKYKPGEMFSCLADAVIAMMGGRIDVL